MAFKEEKYPVIIDYVEKEFVEKHLNHILLLKTTHLIKTDKLESFCGIKVKFPATTFLNLSVATESVECKNCLKSIK